MCEWVCVCVLCLSANPLTLRVVNLPTLRRVNLFLLLCRRVEGLSSAFALSMGGNRGRLGRRKEWCCAHCKAACMTACVAYNYKSRGKKGNICYPKQNGCTTILADFQLRAFVAFPLPPFPLGAFAWIIIFAFLMRSHTESFKHFVH